MNNFIKMGASYTGSESIAPAESALRMSSSAAEVFGNDSRLFDNTVWIEPASKGLFIYSEWFHVAVLLLMLCYLLTLFQHPDLVRFVFNRILSPDTTHSERLYDDKAVTNSHIIGSIIVTGLFFATVLGVKLLDIALPTAILETLPSNLVDISVPATAISVVAIVLFQILLLQAIGKITISQPTTSSLIYLKELYFAFSLFMIAPNAVLYALCPSGEGWVWLTTIALQLLCVTTLYLRETFLLFIAKKVSIFHWILYLCAVEMFPATLVWLIAAKTFVSPV